ncbi:hypothetical protein AB0M36_04750 [Actinoplanes sp. NPDC051346]|uniref:hypothetical protein n=1 Tax=Actinoplanes sp. NPDC051346 TaxID=3155048 RepID=UPI00341D82FF
MLIHDPDGPILLAGGYGVVGAELAHLLHQHHPESPLLLAGRHPRSAGGSGAAVAAATDAGLLRWDLADPAPPVAVRALITTVNDPADHALRGCLTAGVPYVDITRWTSRLQAALALTATVPPKAPVALSSGWMGGLVPRIVGHLCATVGGAAEIDVAIRYDVRDRAGADSVEFLDRLGVDFPARGTDGERMVTPLTQVRTVAIGADRVRVARIDTPEQFTLPMTLGARRSATRIGFSAGSATGALLTLRRLGFFRVARGDRLRGLRRSLIYRPGPGGEARLRIDVAGPEGTRTVTVGDPRGQAHLTAVGALLSLRDALAARGGVLFPELSASPDLLAQLGTLGVRVDAEVGLEAAA